MMKSENLKLHEGMLSQKKPNTVIRWHPCLVPSSNVFVEISNQTVITKNCQATEVGFRKQMDSIQTKLDSVQCPHSGPKNKENEVKGRGWELAWIEDKEEESLVALLDLHF